MTTNFILKGDICYSITKDNIEVQENAFLVCENGISKGVYSEIPLQYESFSLLDYSGHLIIPGMTDLHLHAPQYAFRGIGMDMELLDWLNHYTFPEEAKYQDEAYAKQAYRIFVRDLIKSATTRACIFATVHVPATLMLAELLEASGLITYVGKVNMDRNAPDYLLETDADASADATSAWLSGTAAGYVRTKPILTPRFIPTCSDALMEKLGELQRTFRLPVQSHLSENLGEIEWVKELCPKSEFYGDAYDRFGLFGKDAKTVMAHCVSSSAAEIQRIKENGVYIAHCPQSNINLASGIAPVRTFLDEELQIGLGTDIAAGASLSMFRAITDAVQVSKLYWRLVDASKKPLSVAEAFYLATKGGGSFFGKTGSFEEGYAADILILDESQLPHPQELSAADRLVRFLSLADHNHILHKYVAGNLVF